MADTPKPGESNSDDSGSDPSSSVHPAESPTSEDAPSAEPEAEPSGDGDAVPDEDSAASADATQPPPGGSAQAAQAAAEPEPASDDDDDTPTVVSKAPPEPSLDGTPTLVPTDAPASPEPEAPPKKEVDEHAKTRIFEPSEVAAMMSEAGLRKEAEAKDAEGDESGEEPLAQSFDELDLPDAVRTAVANMGWDSPTPVQAKTFPLVAAGKDILVQSQTGSGKTGAFCLPWLAQRFEAGDATQTGVQMLVLTPTRELAKQVCDQLQQMAQDTDVRTLPIYGGTAMQPQLQALRDGIHAVVGTPGRILDHIRRRSLKLDRVRMAVLDEADEMLSMGFLEDIHAILDACATERQTCLFSATVPPDIERIARRYMHDPESVMLSGDQVAAAEINHVYYQVSGTIKVRALLDMIAIEEPANGLVFCNTREETYVVASALHREGFQAEPLSSDLTQAARERVMGRMRGGQLRFLVATDVASRGIDISHIGHVINYSFPENAESYVHRTGRTGRAGRPGVAISLISPKELGNHYYLKLQYPSIVFEERSLPSPEELGKQRIQNKLDQVSRLFPELVSPEWTLLTRNLMTDPRGEQVLAFLLKEAMTRIAQERDQNDGIETRRPRGDDRRGRGRGRRDDFGDRDRERPERGRGRWEDRPEGEPQARDRRDGEDGAEGDDRRRRRSGRDRGRRDEQDRDRPERDRRDERGDREPRGDRPPREGRGERDREQRGDRPPREGRGERDRDGRRGRGRGRDRDRDRDPRDGARDRDGGDRRDEQSEQEPERRRRRRRSREPESAQTDEAQTNEGTSDAPPVEADVATLESAAPEAAAPVDAESVAPDAPVADADAKANDDAPSSDDASADQAPSTEGAAEGESPATAEGEDGGRRRRRRRRRRRGGRDENEGGEGDDKSEAQPEPESQGDTGAPSPATAIATDDLGATTQSTADPDEAVEATDDVQMVEAEGGSDEITDPGTMTGLTARRRRRRRRRRGRGRDDENTSETPEGEAGESQTATDARPARDGRNDESKNDDESGDGKRRRRRRRGGRRRGRGGDGATDENAPSVPNPVVHVSQDQIVIDIDETELEVVRDEFGEIDELDDLTLKGRRRGVMETLQDEVELEDLSAADRTTADSDDGDSDAESDEDETDETDETDDGSEESSDAEASSDESGDAEAAPGADEEDPKELKKRKRRRRRRRKKAPAPPPELTAPPHKDFWEVWANRFTYQDFEDSTYLGGTAAVPDEPDEPERPPRRASSSPPPEMPAVEDEEDFVRVRLNVGRKHGKKAAHIRELLAESFGLARKAVRDLTVGEASSRFRLGAKALVRLEELIVDFTFDGIDLTVTHIDPKPKPSEAAPAEPQEAKADEPEAKADEPEAKADEPEAKADEPEAKADEPEAKADEPEAKADEPEAKADEPEAKADEPEAKADEPEAKADEPEAKADEPETKADEPAEADPAEPTS